MAKLRAAGQAPPPRPACELLPTSTSASVSSHCVTSIPGSLASDDCHLILSHDSGAEQTQPQVSLGSLVGLQSGDCCAGMPMMPLPPATGGQTRASVCVSVSHTHHTYLSHLCLRSAHPCCLGIPYPIVALCPGARNEIIQTTGLKQWRFIFSRFWRLEVRDQGAGREAFF